MKHNYRNRLAVGTLVLGGTLVLAACEKDAAGTPNPPSAAWEQAYVIPATVDGTTYLLTAPTLDEGSISTRGNGTEVLNGTY